MSYGFYLVLHIIGITSTLTGLIALLYAGYTAGGFQKVEKRVRAFTFAIHGTGLFLTLVSGFGMLAKLGIIASMPTWVFYKLGIWVILGASISLSKRFSKQFLPLTLLYLCLIGIAASVIVLNRGQ